MKRICFICRNTERIQAGQFAGLPCPSCGLHQEKDPDCKCTPIEMCDKCWEWARLEDKDEDSCICKEDNNDPNCPECY